MNSSLEKNIFLGNPKILSISTFFIVSNYKNRFFYCFWDLGFSNSMLGCSNSFYFNVWVENIMFLLFLRSGLLKFRDQLTKDDIKVYGYVSEKPSDAFPNVAGWYDVVSSQLAARYVLFSSILFLNYWFLYWNMNLVLFDLIIIC